MVSSPACRRGDLGSEAQRPQVPGGPPTVLLAPFQGDSNEVESGRLNHLGVQPVAPCAHPPCAQSLCRRNLLPQPPAMGNEAGRGKTPGGRARPRQNWTAAGSRVSTQLRRSHLGSPGGQGATSFPNPAVPTGHPTSPTRGQQRASRTSRTSEAWLEAPGRSRRSRRSRCCSVVLPLSVQAGGGDRPPVPRRPEAPSDPGEQVSGGRCPWTASTHRACCHRSM